MLIHALEILAMYTSSLTYSIINDCPKKELPYAAITGFVVWVFYLIAFYISDSILVANFCSTFLVTVFCKILTLYRRQPLTLYLVPAIIPLVPGKTIFDTLFALVSGDFKLAQENAFLTFSIACCITLGISMSNIINYTYLKKVFKIGEH